MAGVFAAITDKKKRAMNMARFRAWWEGEDFDEATALAELEQAVVEAADGASPASAPKTADKDVEVADALFDDPPTPSPPRFAALQKFWGEGRIMPGDVAADAARLARLELPEAGALAVLGPGLAAPLRAIAETYPGEMIALEWRADAKAPLEAALKRLPRDVPLRMIDLDAFAAAAEAFDGVISFDEFTYADPSALVPALAACLKPNARALIEFYAGHPQPAIEPAFATAFAEPRLRSASDLIEGLTHAGFAIEADEDQTAEHIERGRAGFRHLERALAEATAADMNVAILQEIAWEAAAWRARLKLLQQRRLERRVIVARKQS
ncbi:MAG: hypothetical protein JNJ73_09550 [Hyphomonadaceae bacterium]|nr:hypothetical protein [Hyphomonadaceae bacterium]